MLYPPLRLTPTLKTGHRPLRRPARDSLRGRLLGPPLEFRYALVEVRAFFQGVVEPPPLPSELFPELVSPSPRKWLALVLPLERHVRPEPRTDHDERSGRPRGEFTQPQDMSNSGRLAFAAGLPDRDKLPAILVLLTYWYLPVVRKASLYRLSATPASPLRWAAGLLGRRDGR